MFTEEDLLRKALKNGNKEELMKVYEKIYNNYVKLVSFSVGKYIDDTEHIKDITNDVFLAFFNNAPKITSSIKYYLLKTARNMAIKHLVKEKRLELNDDFDSFIKDYGFSSHNKFIELVNDLKSFLSPEEVEIILLHVIDGYTFKEISSIIKIPHKTVNKIYERAIKKYRKDNDL